MASSKNNKSIENYYDILELDKTCTKADIESSYRRLAIQWHPDKNKNNGENAEKKFREISKAYQILSDDQTRTNYDSHGVIVEDVENLFDPYEMFKNIFDTEFNKIPDVILTIEADIDRLYKGFTELIKFTRFSQCEKCNNMGTRDSKKADCGTCKGRGILLETVKGGKIGYMINEKKCKTCDGNGIDPRVKLCKKCSGVKYIKEDIECDVDVPPGAYDNYYIKLEDEGNFIPKDERKNKKSRTDVIVVIKEKNQPECRFKRGMFIQEINRINMADILLSLDISFGESIVGIHKDIDFLAGEKIGVSIDNVICHGDVYVIKNMGMPLVPEELNKNQNQSRGDLFLRFIIDKESLSKLSKQKRNRMWQIITDTPYPNIIDIENIYPSINLESYIKERQQMKIDCQKNDTDDETSDSQINENSNKSNDADSNESNDANSSDSNDIDTNIKTNSDTESDTVSTSKHNSNRNKSRI